VPRCFHRYLPLFILVTNRMDSHSPAMVSLSSSPSPLTRSFGALPDVTNTFLGLVVSHSIFPYPPFCECRSGAPYLQALDHTVHGPAMGPSSQQASLPFVYAVSNSRRCARHFRALGWV